MKHVLYAYGDKERISWLIESDEKTVFENREHVENYKDKISNSESKTIALHVGIFWGIGVFIIKNKDSIKIKIDDTEIFDEFTGKKKSQSELIQKRIGFIRQLINQRKLEVSWEVIIPEDNKANRFEK